MLNPDVSELLVPGLTNMTGLAEDYSLKLPIRRKAHYCELILKPRPTGQRSARSAWRRHFPAGTNRNKD
jgi:hypothetical protein